MAKALEANKLAMVCMVLLCLIILSAVFAFLSPYDPDTMDVMLKMAPPSAEHWFGTDELGRDSFTRALYGGRVSLTVGFAAMVVSVIIGTAIGSVSGYVGGSVDTVLMRIVDIFQSVPSLLLIIVFFSFVPNNMLSLVIMLALFSWSGVARIVRAQTLTLKERDFVIAAQTLGGSHPIIILKHIIPNMTTQIIVAASLSVANAILAESALSFLGYGVALPKSSWGSMLQNAQQYISFTKEVQIIFQDPYSSLDPKMKVGDIIAEGLRAHKMCASREEEQKIVRDLLETVGLNSEHATRYVHEFSGGQRQRIGIAPASGFFYKKILRKDENIHRKQE